MANSVKRLQKFLEEDCENFVQILESGVSYNKKHKAAKKLIMIIEKLTRNERTK